MVGSPDIHSRDGEAVEQNQGLRAKTLAPPCPALGQELGDGLGFPLT